MSEPTAVPDQSGATRDPRQVREEAEAHFRSGRMNCAEAVLEAMRTAYCPDMPENVVRMAAGFGGGSGSGCMCGAISGGTMALGMVLKGDRKRTMLLTKELHGWFNKTYGSVCCRVILAERKGICADLTGKVAGRLVELLNG